MRASVAEVDGAAMRQSKCGRWHRSSLGDPATRRIHEAQFALRRVARLQWGPSIALEKQPERARRLDKSPAPTARGGPVSGLSTRLVNGTTIRGFAQVARLRTVFFAMPTSQRAAFRFGLLFSCWAAGCADTGTGNQGPTTSPSATDGALAPTQSAAAPSQPASNPTSDATNAPPTTGNASSNLPVASVPPLAEPTSTPPLSSSAPLPSVEPTPSGGGAPNVEGSTPPVATSAPPEGTAGSAQGGAPNPDPGPVVPEPTLITSSEGNFWQIGEVTEGGSTPTITVNEGEALQEWFGFGGTFNELGWEVLQALSAEERDRAIRLLFDKTEGAAFTQGRIPIGSSDYSRDRYSLAPEADDFDMSSFSIERDREMLIPFIQAAQVVNPALEFWASPWSPPPWMKDNNDFDGGNMKTDAQTLAAHALYLAKFVQEYAAEGIDIYAVHPQNEPGYQTGYPSCGWTGAQMADYVSTHLGPLLEELSLPTEIWMGTMSNNVSDKALLDAVLANAGARSYLRGIGLQWGMVDHAQSYADEGLLLMQTEHKCGNYNFDQPDIDPNDGIDISWSQGQRNNAGAPNDYAYGVETWALIRIWITRGAHAYLAWNMVLDTAGMSMTNWPQNALLTVDTQAQELIVTPAYYAFRHVSQYVEPGAVRLGTQGGDALAFRNPDGSIVTALFNAGNSPAETTLAVAGKNLQFTVPARGWATVNWQAQ
jgi:glucosylceramidase